jgi:hypothetical protein
VGYRGSAATEGAWVGDENGWGRQVDIIKRKRKRKRKRIG